MSETYPHAQAEITSNVRVDSRLAGRLRNRQTASGASYPLLGKEDIEIKRNELVFGWRRPTNVRGAHRPGRSSEEGFSSFSGVGLEEYESVAELAASIYLIGVSSTNHDPTNPLQVQNDLAVTRFGIRRVAYDQALEPTYPGDILAHSPPPMPDKDGEYRLQFGNSTERPPSKALAVLRPLNPARINDSFYHLFSTMMSRQGVYDNLFDDLENESSRGLSAHEQAALGLKQFVLAAGLQTISALATRGIVKIMTPSETERDTAAQTFLDAVREALPALEGAADARAQATAGQAFGTTIAQAAVAFGVRERGIVETNPARGANVEYKSPIVNGLRSDLPQLVSLREYFRSDQHRTKMSPDELKKARMRDQRSLLFLADKVGFVGDMASTSKIVQDDILYSVFSQFTHDTWGDEFLPNMSLVGALDETPMARMYAERAIFAPTLFASSLQTAMNDVMATIAGVSLSYSDGRSSGAKVDVLFRGGNSLCQ